MPFLKKNGFLFVPFLKNYERKSIIYFFNIQIIQQFEIWEQCTVFQILYTIFYFSIDITRYTFLFICVIFGIYTQIDKQEKFKEIRNLKTFKIFFVTSYSETVHWILSTGGIFSSISSKKAKHHLFILLKTQIYGCNICRSAI